MCFYNYLAWNVAHSVWLPDCVFIPLIATDSAWHKWFSLWIHWTALQPIFKAGFGVCVLFLKESEVFWSKLAQHVQPHEQSFFESVLTRISDLQQQWSSLCLHSVTVQVQFVIIEISLQICVRLSSGYWLPKKWHFNSFQIKAYGQYLQKKKKHAKKRKNSLLFCEQYDKVFLLWF